ncbi:hypothetical protein V8F33_014158, partial [Rhypophila sp. PSN 637]
MTLFLSAAFPERSSPKVRNVSSAANLAPSTPKVSADEYWKELSTDVEPEIAMVNSDTWATELEESLNNSLGIIQEEKEEEAATWQDRWANRR